MYNKSQTPFSLTLSLAAGGPQYGGWQRDLSCSVDTSWTLSVKHKTVTHTHWDNEMYSIKWKNHFYEMKGDVGMSLHEKGRNKKMPTPRQRDCILVEKSPVVAHALTSAV